MRISLITVLFTSCLACGLTRAGTPKEKAGTGQAHLTTKRVVVFKDGHGLFIKEAIGRADTKGLVYIDQLPDQASLGSFWVTDRKHSLESMVAGRAEHVEQEILVEDCQSVYEVLRANKGKQARLVVQNDKIHEGIILSVLEQPVRSPAGEAPLPWTPSSGHISHIPTSAASGSATTAVTDKPQVEIQSPQGRYFVLRTEKGDELIDALTVQTVRVEGMKVVTERRKTTRKAVKHLRLNYDKPRSGRQHKLDLMYFRPGIRWIPTYRIDLADDGSAVLTMQAVVINEAEDIVDAAVDFVVGLPTFRFQGEASPLTLERVLINAVSQVAPALGNRLAAQSFSNFSNAVFNDRVSRARPSGPGEIGSDVAVSAMEGGEVQDLYYYSTKRLSLKKGERAAVEVLRVKVPYRHLYTWDLALGRSGPDVHTGYHSPLKLTTNKVWHQVVLENKSGRPWTTGPALLLESGLPVGQDMLTFTPAGREVMVPLTAAVSVRGTVDEEELSRIHGARKIRTRSYTRVRNKATFKMVNSLKVPVKLVVQAGLAGKATATTDGGDIQLQGKSAQDAEHQLLNQGSRITWDLELAPGETRKVQATYHYYLRE